MIRINLLPKEEKAPRPAAITFKAGDLVVPAVLLVTTALVIGGMGLSQYSRATSLARSIAEVDEQSRALAPQIERVNRLAQERAELDLRLGIIARLEQGRAQSVRLMDDLARCVPDHLWLSGATQDSPGSLSVEGVTFSNLVVSDFISRLERSSLFANVELDFAERGMVNDREVVKFRVTCSVTPDEPAH
jgi:type IV pilus assembly protein PilN